MPAFMQLVVGCLVMTYLCCAALAHLGIVFSGSGPSPGAITQWAFDAAGASHLGWVHIGSAWLRQAQHRYLVCGGALLAGFLACTSRGRMRFRGPAVAWALFLAAVEGAGAGTAMLLTGAAAGTTALVALVVGFGGANDDPERDVTGHSALFGLTVSLELFVRAAFLPVRYLGWCFYDAFAPTYVPPADGGGDDRPTLICTPPITGT